jgi:hypothetical protein
VAALLARDGLATSQALAGLVGTGSHGAIVKLGRRRALAGIAALESRTDEALAGFRGVQEELRRLELPYLLALTDVMACAVLDPTLPDVAAAAEEARDIFERLGAKAWLDRLEEAFAGGSPGQTGATTVTRTPTAPIPAA